MNIDFEKARDYYDSRGHLDSYEERERRRIQEENKRYDEWARNQKEWKDL